jgi:hypothetical protein
LIPVVFDAPKFGDDGQIDEMACTGHNGIGLPCYNNAFGGTFSSAFTKDIAIAAVSAFNADGER